MSRHNIHVPIYGLTSSPLSQRKMALYRNVRPMLMPSFTTDRDAGAGRGREAAGRARRAQARRHLRHHLRRADGLPRRHQHAEGLPRDDTLAGCGAMRPLPDVDHANACEMKRLFVRPAFRGFGLGRVMAQALIDRAASAGYSSMLLDTLDDMASARALYASLGFEEVAPYYFNPIAGAHYMKVQL
jgi:ribosomal protein S18 acetylase RimI-like enzyme